MMSLTTSLRARTRQPMTNGLALLVHCSVRQKLNCVSLVQLVYVALYALLNQLPNHTKTSAPVLHRPTLSQLA